MPTTSLMPLPKQQYSSAIGTPLVGGKVYTYAAGTTNPKATYTDAAGTTEHENPITLNARGEPPAPVFWGGNYRVDLRDALGNLVYSVDNYADPASIVDSIIAGFQLSDYAALRAYRGSQKMVYVTGYLVTASPSGIAGGFVRDDMDHASVDNAGTIIVDVLGRRWKRVVHDSYNVKWFGALGAGVDDSAAVLAAYNALQIVGGGVLEFPFDVYSFYLDVSARTKFVKFKGNYSAFRPAASRPKQAIIYCDNTGAVGGFQHSYTQYDRCFFDSQNIADYSVYLAGACADFEFCAFQQAKVASMYGTYAQYCRFASCTFASNVFANTSFGCYMTGPDGSHRSNEVWFERCQFFTNKNHLYIGGGEATRIHDCTFQDGQAGGTAGVYIHTDLAGNSARYTDITGCWFEINQSKALLIGTAEGTNIERNKFFGNRSYTCVVESVTSYDLRFVNNSALSYTTVTFAHPAANTDTASVTIHGGNIWPILNLDHNGPTRVSGESAGTGLMRNDSMLYTSAQNDQNSIPVVGFNSWFGRKSVPKGVTTTLFAINQLPYNTPAYRVVEMEVKLRSWDNANSATQYAYSGHVQTFEVLITNNNTGAPQVIIQAVSAGTDLSISPTWQTPGPFTLTASVSGDVITFSAQWSGAGAGVAGMSSQCMTYTLSGAGTNSFHMTRL